MTGTEEYNNKWIKYAEKRINDNKDKEYLGSFYYYILADTSYSASYTYLGHVINFVNNFKIVDPSTIKLDHYTRYIAQNKGNVASYQIVVYSALKKFSLFLKANGYCDDYMQYIKRPRFNETQKTKQKRENGFMTKDEVACFINEVKNTDKETEWKARDLAMITLLLNTGIRCSALQKLDVDDFNPNKKTITVLEKGDSSRTIYLSRAVVDNILDWLRYRNRILDGSTETALFISDRKSRIVTRTIYNIIKRYGSVIDGKNITPHKTRATFGTQLYDKTHDVYFVQQCMGHSNPKTTELYIRGQKGNMSKKAAELMSDIINYD